MGMPGVGKGTQATRLKEDLGGAHISTGDILRAAVHDGSPLGRRVRQQVQSGRLVPDPLMGDLVVERLGERGSLQGFILDGFPRTLGQLQFLDRTLERLELPIDRVILLVAPVEQLVRRLEGRRVCPRCDSTYHVETRPPKAAGICDRCGTALAQRPDDTGNGIRDRLAAWKESPVTTVICGTGQIEAVRALAEMV